MRQLIFFCHNLANSFVTSFMLLTYVHFVLIVGNIMGKESFEGVYINLHDCVEP